MTRSVNVLINDNAPTAAQIIEDYSVVEEDSGGLFSTQFQNQAVAEAKLHVWSAHVEGSYVTQLKNSGRLPILRTKVENMRSQMQEAEVELANFSSTVGLLRRGNSVSFNNHFDVRGVWDAAWSLISIFFRGGCTVVETARVSGLGYSKSTNSRIGIPVRSVSVHWDSD